MKTIKPIAYAAHEADEGFNFIAGWPEAINDHINEAIADDTCSLPYRLVRLYDKETILAVIELCAKVADNKADGGRTLNEKEMMREIGAAIRIMKDEL